MEMFLKIFVFVIVIAPFILIAVLLVFWDEERIAEEEFEKKHKEFEKILKKQSESRRDD